MPNIEGSDFPTREIDPLNLKKSSEHEKEYIKCFHKQTAEKIKLTLNEIIIDEG